MLKRLLSDPHRYQAQIEHLHNRYIEKKKLQQLQHDGVPLSSIIYDINNFSVRLADTIACGKYNFSPGKTYILTVANKQRLLYQFQLTDLIVHGVVAHMLHELAEPKFSSNLYSYRRGMDWWGALSSLARYVRSHCSEHPDVTTRGLYVIRRDICSYSDSIRVDGKAEIWKILGNLLKMDNGGTGGDKNFWSIIENVVRPEMISDEGYLYRNTVGVPTGSPVSTALFNIYIMSIDDIISGIPGGFYARYSDDILFAHPDPDVVRSTDKLFCDLVAAKSLAFNEKKAEILFFNGAGRPSLDFPAAKGTTRVNFLGSDVSFRGEISLSEKKMRSVLRDVSARTRRTLAAIQLKDRMRAGRAVCAVVNEALDPWSAAANKFAQPLRYVVTSRQQLKSADYQIALAVARSITGMRGVKAFRKIPYRTMRQDWGLKSLYHTRNKML